MTLVLTDSFSVPSSSPLPLCVLIPAGPGEAEIARVSDLLEACAADADLPLCDDQSCLVFQKFRQGDDTFRKPCT
jgi:hypothetical protein